MPVLAHQGGPVVIDAMVTAVSQAEPREIVKAMAAIGRCDCGCGCGGHCTPG
jgi:hypothetical protein